MSTGNSSNVPMGWENRNNTMSEHDMRLGGIAATKFATNQKNCYGGGDGSSSSATYKTSDQVRDFYLNDYHRPGEEGTNNSSTVDDKAGASLLPDFWATRQKERDIQAKQMGVFSRRDGQSAENKIQRIGSSSSNNAEKNVNESSPLPPEVALVQIATHTLETMAKALKGNPNATIPLSERTAFANALKEAMDALAK